MNRIAWSYAAVSLVIAACGADPEVHCPDGSVVQNVADCSITHAANGCAEGEYRFEGQCQASVCVPNCDVNECGPDGCGGICGFCEFGVTCWEGQCAFDPPPTWDSNPSYYNANDGCDCECGAYDPDCNRAGSTVYGCPEQGIPKCDHRGSCLNQTIKCEK